MTQFSRPLRILSLAFALIAAGFLQAGEPECTLDADCEDARFCNGEAVCSDGRCLEGPVACPGRGCDETTDTCLGTVALQPRMGQPLLGLTGDGRDRFRLGRLAFDRILLPGEGLGPIFNQRSCGSCHSNPAGGSGSRLVTRFGFNDDKGGGFDPLTNLGGSLLQEEAIAVECLETVPPQANLTASRVTPSTLGLGLVEALEDADLLVLQDAPPAGISGRAHWVTPLESPGTMRVGRMGWKAQVATVLTFSGDAALNEMGLTNRLVGAENPPNGDHALLAACDSVPDPEDLPDAAGLEFIDRVTDFQRFLAAPPQTPRSGMSGESIFDSIGCIDCHTATFTTPDDPTVEPALRNATIRPYSDFLLHDMGLAADFIVDGDASGREMRTPALWGVRARDPLWHDGRFVGGTFPDRIRLTIAEHDRLGSEARSAAQAFAASSPGEQDALVAFLDSLGRPEFDLDGDGNVNATDFVAFGGCRGQIGVVADDGCAPADADQDGDVDDDDFYLFTLAAQGNAGSIPDRPGPSVEPLRLRRVAGGELELTWSPSCLSGDIDYEVYEGTLGAFDSHAPRLCSTAASTSALLNPAPQSAYYLVVPTNGFKEGSYGASSHAPRPPSAAACLPLSIGECD